jgi:glycosyltransferase involved in cell wall biosynthesis
LQGFAIQETPFPIVFCIVDDASTDDEPNILRAWAANNLDLNEERISYRKNLDYGEIIVAHLKNKSNSLFVILLLSSNHKQVGKAKSQYLSEWEDNSKYLAFCEGDDYWIDPNKLRKQVDFMETHPDYGLIHTNFESIPVKRLTSSVPNNKKDEYLIDLLNGNYPIGTLTTMYRTSLLKKLPNYSVERTFKMGDQPRGIEFASVSKIKYLDCVTAIYRITENSASHNKDIQKELEFYKSSMECRQFYADRFNVKIKNQLPMFYEAAIKSAFNHRLPDVACMLLQQAKAERALSLKVYFFYLGTKYKIIRSIINSYYKR